MEGKAKPSMFYDSESKETKKLSELTEEEYRNFIKVIYEKNLCKIGYKIADKNKKGWEGQESKARTTDG